MARSNTAPAQETNPPDLLAWHVANKGDKGYWTRIGAAWFHRDRKGLSLQLEVVPINGRIVLRTQLDDEKKAQGASARRMAYCGIANGSEARFGAGN